jgi:hypothetical protein
MGRRARDAPMVKRIKIKIGPYVNTFALDREMLVGRAAAINHVREIRELARAFSQSQGASSGPANLSQLTSEANHIAFDDFNLTESLFGNAFEGNQE